MAVVIRTLTLCVFGFAVAILTSPAALAQDVAPIDVIVVEGPLDRLAVRFVETAIEESAEQGAQVAIIELDSPGALDEEIEDLLSLFEQPPVPVVVWVGAAPAVAYGGAAQLLMAAGTATAAPGVEIGYLAPTVAGTEGGPEVASALDGTAVEVTGPIPDLVEATLPSIGQVVVWLHGREVGSAGAPASLNTARPEVGEDGVTRMLPVAEVRFREPGLLTRVLRSAVRPEAAFFFVVVGLTVAAFEFYAIGPGLAAAAGIVSVLIGGYGLATLPVRWWSLALIGLALLTLTAEFQRRSFGLLSVLATAGLVTGGLFLTDAAPQLRPSPWGVALTVVVALFFYLIAMPVVARSRFSTGTIGREHLIGRSGLAATDLGPEGIVEVDGARWQARSHREAGIRAGDPVRVEAVRGLWLEVGPGPADEGRENIS